MGIGQDIIDIIRGKKCLKVVKKADIEKQKVFGEYSVPYTLPNEEDTYKKLVITGGFGHSGSGTLIDYFSEFDNFTVLGYHDFDCTGAELNKNNIEEIDFVRRFGGFYDIENYLNGQNFSVIISTFLHMAEFFYRKGGIYSDKFWEIVNDFVEEITEFKVKSNTGLEGQNYMLFTENNWTNYTNLKSPLLRDRTKKFDRFMYYVKKCLFQNIEKLQINTSRHF